MKKLFYSVVLLGVLNSHPASALTCWKIYGWTESKQAKVIPISCDTTPLNTGWVEPLQADIGNPIWLQISLSDTHVNGWQFTPLLVFDNIYDINNKPVVRTDLIPSVDADNSMQLLPFSPKQGTPTAGARVRIRHVNSNKCVYSDSQNGNKVFSDSCENTDNKTYVLDNAGNGYYRLRHEKNNQCLYTTLFNGEPVYHWQCWNDPNMKFRVKSTGFQGRYRIESVYSNQCLYNDNWQVKSSICWDDRNMDFYIDIINKPVSPTPIPIPVKYPTLLPTNEQSLY